MAVAVSEPTPSSGPGLSPVTDEDLELLLLIRHFEQKLLELFGQGKLNGTTHTCLGQEHIPVALRPLFERQDFIFSNHRGHGHYLARFRDPHGLLAEIMGREGAVCNGVGGSQHILRDRHLSTGVQGESLPVATGVALHLKRTSPGLLAVAHIGDGTWGEGAVYEALNIAQLWRLPLLVIVEHNGIAQSTPTRLQMAGTIADRAHAFGIRHRRVSSIDLAVIRAELAAPLSEARARSQPLVVEFDTPRLGPHSKGDDTRDSEALRLAAQRDWYPRYADAFPGQFRRIDARQRAYIDAVAQEVERRPLATWEPACESTSA